MAGGPSLQFIAISQDDAKSTKQFNTEFGVRFRTLLDEEDAGYQTSNAYGISYVPSMFLIEQDGRVSWADHGFSKRDLEDLGRRAGIAPFHDGDRVPEAKSG
jgi:peroxiredoxin